MEDRIPMASRILWNYIKNKRLGGYQFEYFGGKPMKGHHMFYSPEAKLIVRIGHYELTSELSWQNQMIREKKLTQRGIVLFSFHPDHVIGNIDLVLSKILTALNERSKHWRETIARLN